MRRRIRISNDPYCLAREGAAVVSSHARSACCAGPPARRPALPVSRGGRRSAAPAAARSAALLRVQRGEGVEAELRRADAGAGEVVDHRVGLKGAAVEEAVTAHADGAAGALE